MSTMGLDLNMNQLTNLDGFYSQQTYPESKKTEAEEEQEHHHLPSSPAPLSSSSELL